MARIALCDARGPLTDLLQKLSGENGDRWISTLNNMLRNGLIFFPTWKTIKLGTYKFADDLSEVLMSRGFRIGDRAMQVLKKIPLADVETKVELVLMTVAELGFTSCTRCDAIYDRAKQLGLDLVLLLTDYLAQ